MTVMKRISNLYERIISLDNLRLADEKARKGKGNTYGVRRHDISREENLIALHESLKNKTFRTSDYDIFKIYEPKEREIYRLPYYPDRIVHHAVMNVLEPVWVSIFTSDTFSCIKGRGIHGCARKVKEALKDKENARYCLKIDVRKYYPSIDHEVMKTIVRKKIKCNDTLWLLDQVIDSAEGLPIGNYLSQYFANLYLAYFDHYIKEVKGLHYYFRYADDMVFLHSEKDFLHALLTDVQTYLNDRLNLQLKANYQVFPVDSRGIDFVGYVFYHTHTLMRKSIKQSLCRRASKINPIEKMTREEYRRNLCSWMGWAKHCNSKNLVKKIIKSEYYDNL